MTRDRSRRWEVYWVVLGIASLALVVLGTANAVFGHGSWLIPVGPAFTATASFLSLASLRQARRRREEDREPQAGP